jgi:hypothetical protein
MINSKIYKLGCRVTICTLLFLAQPRVFWAQQNLVPNGMLLDFKKDSLNEVAFVEKSKPTATEISNWELNKCQTFYETDSQHISKAFIELILYEQLGPKDFEIWNAIVKLCRPLTKGNTYRVDLWLKPLTGTAYSGGISVAFSDKLLEAKHFYELPSKRNGKIDLQSDVVPVFKYLPVVSYNTAYTKISFEYAATGGEVYLYVGNFNIGKPDVWQETTPFGYMRPAFDYSAYSIYALGGMSVTPKDTLEFTCNSDSFSSANANVAEKDTVYIGNICFESKIYDKAIDNDSLWLKVKQYHTYKTAMLLGYTDETGTKAFNDSLSLQRANYVAGILKNTFGMQTVGVGLGVDRNSTDPKKSRRVEVFLIK